MFTFMSTDVPPKYVRYIHIYLTNSPKFNTVLGTMAHHVRGLEFNLWHNKKINSKLSHQSHLCIKHLSSSPSIMPSNAYVGSPQTRSLHFQLKIQSPMANMELTSITFTPKFASVQMAHSMKTNHWTACCLCTHQPLNLSFRFGSSLA